MSINFAINDNELVLIYNPDYGVESVRKSLNDYHEIYLKRCFNFSIDDLRESDDENEFVFYLGIVDDEYIKIESRIIETENTIYFSKDIKIESKLFYTENKVSILKQVDAIIDCDLYIGGNWEKHNGISDEMYYELLKRFPKKAEMFHYTQKRIATVLKENFPQLDKYKEIYDKFITKRNKKIENDKENSSTYNDLIELKQFELACKELSDLLNESEGISEDMWQKKIFAILKLLYPKYIYCDRELTFKGTDGYDKRPDFILVDSNGIIDLLEIKKPEIPILTKQSSYRNNYVPRRDFSGAIQQIEKYIYCLNNLNSNDVFFEKLDKKLPNNLKSKVFNPQGILLIGRSNDFNSQQIQDFELIRRQYKNITDVITYDELLFRLNNIRLSLKEKIENN